MKVFVSNIDLISQNPECYTALLEPKHRVRAIKFKNLKRRLRFVLGHLMAMHSGKKYTSIAYIDNVVVVAAASNAPVGVDIENTKYNIDTPDIPTGINLPAPKNDKELYRNLSFVKSAYKLGTRPHCRQFMRYGDYIICLTSVKFFDMPRLHKFIPDSILNH